VENIHRFPSTTTNKNIAMKFSVLLPTKERLQYLKYAVASVMSQDYADWEIIISDNFSEEKVEDYIRSLNDPRIHYFRTAAFVPVTENWNNTIERATGDYVIMLGDDDCLLPGYFSFYLKLIKEFDNPDVFYNSALNYVYPGVMPNTPDGYLVKWRYASFFINKERPFVLEKEQRMNLVRELMGFNLTVNFNAQHSLISRKLIEETRSYGKFYQSPYPDYYSTTVLLAKAAVVVAVPDRTVVIGVTPKSFGFYYFNGIEEQGVQFLKNIPDPEIYQNISKYLLVGTDMNISWLIAMETVRRNFGSEYNLKVKYRKFRFLQTLVNLKKFVCKENYSFGEFFSFFKSLFYSEKLLYLIPCLIACVARINSKSPKLQAFANRMPYVFSHPNWDREIIYGQHKDILEVFETLKIGR
jgi:glycosyltransferase involved in cell wall biosynthesis